MTFETQQKDWIGVLGGATRYSNLQVIAAYKIGREIARRGKNLVTGATNGIPYAAAIGAKREGARVVGISPASSVEEHLFKYKKPIDYADIIVYTGLGVAGRSPVIIQSISGAIFIGGEFGTINEFSAAWMRGSNVLGILEEEGGISESLVDLLSKIETGWGSKVLLDSDPIELVSRVCREVDELYLTNALEQRSEAVGMDIKNTIQQFLDHERENSCAMPSGNTLTGKSSTIDLR